jgi:3-hydroxyisobutyrate/3-hydroxypropionate dehydrogenase
MMETAAVARDFEGEFSIELCTGVVEMAVELEKQVGARILLGETVMQGFEEARRGEKCRGRDCRSFYRWLAHM